MRARFCSDPVVEQNMLNDMLAHANGAANKVLESYFHADDFAKNPFQIMTSNRQRSDRIDPPGIPEELRGSLERERTRDIGGAPLGTSHWEAILETEIQPQNSTDTVISNPLGFYVT
jgi:type IV secretory pathway TrbF-like protein